MEFPKPNGILVYVVDDDDNVRDALAKLVHSLGYETETFSSSAAFLKNFRPDQLSCLLLDVYLAEENGFDLFAELARRQLHVPTIFMSGAGTIPMGVHAIKAGGIEFLTKPFEREALRSALDQAAAWADAQSARRAEEAVLRQRLGRLTPRENAVLPYVVRGWINKHIACELSVVEQTVKVHRARVMQKLEVDTVADLVRLAARCKALGIEIAAGPDARAN
jgi:FixJ family two-component response regulator